ncbi:MAG: galactosamine-6-phosphate isomerase [Oscillospiraceae bacterium]|nr:galactosamine-6-phosphate isomerase [Oscillospiraceae bacterium]
MRFTDTKNYDELSLTACNIMESTVIKKPNAIIAVATGSSPTGTYKAFINRIKSKRTDISQVRFVKLDEWLDLPNNHISTCENYIEENLLTPLNINRKNYIAFNSETTDPDTECKRINNWLALNGPIDLCVLGLGKNGHLGLNEPSKYFLPFCHTVTLKDETLKHPMLAKANTVVEKGITLGMTDILSSNEILFLVTGDGKNSAFSNFMSAEVTPECPCTALWLHQNATCVINKSDIQLL